MNINIAEIISEKIKVMEESGLVKKTIEETIEKTVVNAIINSIDGYSIRKNIEELVSNQVSSCVKNIGFTAYNSFIAERLKAVTEGVIRDDISKKIQETMDGIFFQKHENLKLSEIIEKYRDYLCNNLEAYEKDDLQNHFNLNFSESEYGSLVIKLSKEKPKYSYDKSEIEVWIRKGSSGKGSISSLYLEGKNMKSAMKLGPLTKCESLLVNLLLNETEFEIDVESEDDIDTSLDLDY